MGPFQHAGCRPDQVCCCWALVAAAAAASPPIPWDPSGATISNSVALDHPALIVRVHYDWRFVDLGFQLRGFVDLVDSD